tara:strand:- start:307 stop:2331 length:2025 start_codon:yes stop_codon:yes gene_type:complete
MADTIYNKSAESQLDVYKPAKVLQVSFSSATAHKNWPHNDGEGDPWWSGGGSAKPYQYSITFTVTEYSHGSHKTRESRKYNGMDVGVGDWIAGSQDGKCLQIVSVESKSATTVTCIAEDVDRYNVFRSSTGSPIFSTPGTGVLFTLNGEGLPMIDPLPASVVSSDFYPNVMSRFQYLNPMEHFRMTKDAHGFSKGDVIAVTESGDLAKANGSTIARTIGVVSYIGPGPNQFKIKPQNQIIDFNPALPGNVGDFIYADTDGDLTTTDTGKVLFLKIKDAIATTLTSNIANSNTSANSILEINSVNVTLSGGNTTTVVQEINSMGSNHNVVASTTAVPTTAESDSSDYSYGILGGYIPFSGNINGTTVSVSTSPSGNAAYGAGIADATDINNAINNAGITNLTSEVLGSGAIKLTESNGNAISITNVTGDAQGNIVFAGDNSITGLPTSTSASTGVFLRLTQSDGQAIDLEDKSGTPTADLGLVSKQNGQFPLGLYIEHGIKSAGTTIVANTTARDALVAQAGDMAYVTDAGDGEWALYVYTGSAWSEVGNQDSANTDAQTLTETFTMPGGGFGGVETVTLGNISPGARIVEVSVNVTTPLSNYSGNVAPSVDIGDTTDIDAYMTGDESDLSESGVYTAQPNYIYPSTQTNDLNLRVRMNHKSSTIGTCTVSVTYV